MSPSATCHTKGCATRSDQAPHQTQPSAISAMPATQKQREHDQVPCMPRKLKVNVTKCIGRSMSPSPTRATQNAAAPRATSGDQARYETQPNAIRATPAMQSKRRCHQALRLPQSCVCTLLFTRRKLTTVQIQDGVPVNMCDKFINNLRQAVLCVNSLQLNSVHIRAGACSTFDILHAAKLLSLVGRGD